MRFDQKVTGIVNFLGRYLFNLQFLSRPLQSSSPVILYTHVNVVFSLRNTGGTPH